MHAWERFWAEHEGLSRRFFLQAGSAGAAALATWSQWTPAAVAKERPEALAAALKDLESFMTLPADFRDVSRGKPVPHSLSDERKTEVGLTRDTWSLEVVSDSDNESDLRKPLTKEEGTALTFDGLMELGRKHAVRFPKVMTCLNIGCPLGMGIWEGVPLRDVFWLTQPRRDIRRIYYYGFHNDDPKQMFRSSLAIDRILEDPHELPPVILCYKLNGQWLDSERGGPVRVVVPEAYGFKSIKWLQRVVVTNLYHANDTYANGNNDVDSQLKSFAATLSLPRRVKAGQPIPVTGYAQVGVSGVTKVQVWMHKDGEPTKPGDKYHRSAPWQDAEILGPPTKWGGGLADDRIPQPTQGFDRDGRPKSWPIPLAKIHWATLLPPLEPGEYTFRSRTVDAKGIGQPLPRPFRKSGHAAIETVSVEVS